MKIIDSFCKRRSVAFGIPAFLAALVVFGSIVFAQSPVIKPYKQDVIDRHKMAGEQVSEDRLNAIGKRFHDWKASNQVLKQNPELARVKGLEVAQILAYGDLKRRAPELEIHWDAETRLPISISASPLLRAPQYLNKGSESMLDFTGRSFLSSIAKLLRVQEPATEFQLRDPGKMLPSGRRSLRYDQYYSGYQVWGKEIVLRFDAEGNLDLFMGRYAPTPSDLNLEAAVLSPANAVGIAQGDLGLQSDASELRTEERELLQYDGPTAQLVIYAEQSPARLAYVVETRTNLIDRWRYFIDAGTGEVLSKYNATCADGPEKANATDLLGQSREIDTYLHQGNYFMIDASRAMFNAGQSVFPNNTRGAIVTLDARNTDAQTIFHFTSGSNSWTEPSAVSAHYHAGLTYEYYRATHGRNGIDGKGSSIYSVVNVTSNGQSMPNAYWNGKIMAYGNGGSGFTRFAASLDIGAHEMTHGVTEHTANLEYLFQSGALNESFSDIFGCMVERKNWLVGEDITPTNTTFPSGAVRSLQDPHNQATQGGPAWQPKHMNEFVTLDQGNDNGGVHVNSGIPNHAAYLLAQAITSEKMERILYNALTTKLTRQAKLIDFRLAIVQAAQELYGASAAEVTACRQACDQVGITDGNPTPDPDPWNPVPGSDYMVFQNLDPSVDEYLIDVKYPGQQQSDYRGLTLTPSFRKPVVSDDGTVCIFVDFLNNISAVSLDTPVPNEITVDNSGVWSSVALSRDGNFLAVTTIQTDALIHVLDVRTSNIQSRSFTIYTPDYTDNTPSLAEYADAMDFNFDGQYLLFDCYNETVIDGFQLGFWDINLMHVWDKGANTFGSGVVQRIFPQDPGYDLGNPVYSKTKPTIFAFDARDRSAGEAAVLAVDLLNGEPKLISSISPTDYGYPSYSGDDKLLAFSTPSSSGLSTIYVVQMNADALTPAGNPVSFLEDAIYPVFYRRGNRPVSVETEPTAANGFELRQNYPNPFNPSTTVSYTLPDAVRVTIMVHDALGRAVRTLYDDVNLSGGHTVVWDGRNSEGMAMPSGMYHYTLTSGATRLTRSMMLVK